MGDPGHAMVRSHQAPQQARRNRPLQSQAWMPLVQMVG